MHEDPKIKIMKVLSRGRSLREAIRWLNTAIAGDKTPADLMKEGKADRVLKLLKKST